MDFGTKVFDQRASWFDQCTTFPRKVLSQPPIDSINSLLFAGKSGVWEHGKPKKDDFPEETPPIHRHHEDPSRHRRQYKRDPRRDLIIRRQIITRPFTSQSQDKEIPRVQVWFNKGYWSKDWELSQCGSQRYYLHCISVDYLELLERNCEFLFEC